MKCLFQGFIRGLKAIFELTVKTTWTLFQPRLRKNGTEKVFVSSHMASWSAIPNSNNSTVKYMISSLQTLAGLGYYIIYITLAATKLPQENQKSSGSGPGGIHQLLTLQQVGCLLPEGSEPAASCWQSPWLLCHPADTDQVEGKFLTLVSWNPDEEERNQILTSS